MSIAIHQITINDNNNNNNNDNNNFKGFLVRQNVALVLYTSQLKEGRNGNLRR